MRDINPTISITLNICGGNNISKGRLLDWEKKDTTICCLQETQFRFNGTSHASSNHKLKWLY